MYLLSFTNKNVHILLYLTTLISFSINTHSTVLLLLLLLLPKVIKIIFSN